MKKNKKKALPFVQSITFRALPYRPIGKLRPTDEPIEWLNQAEGWRAKEFIDSSGRLYERQRFGDWERWYLILEKIGDHGKILYRYDPSKSPIDLSDAWDRHDDFVFLWQVFHGLIDDAEENNAFGPAAFAGIHHQLDRLAGVLDGLRREIDILRPPELEKQ